MGKAGRLIGWYASLAGTAVAMILAIGTGDLPGWVRCAIIIVCLAFIVASSLTVWWVKRRVAPLIDLAADGMNVRSGIIFEVYTETVAQEHHDGAAAWAKRVEDRLRSDYGADDLVTFLTAQSRSPWTVFQTTGSSPTRRLVETLERQIVALQVIIERHR